MARTAKHSRSLASKNNLAGVLADLGQYTGAEVIHREVVEVREKVSGKEYLETLTSKNNLALMLNIMMRTAKRY